jgi:pimeloyl-ACP methyl ester carboxylesterase
MTDRPTMEVVRLESGSNEWLEGDCWLPPVSHKRRPSEEFAVVYIHGFGSVRGGDKAQALAAECARRGWPFAAFDFRGHGRSSGCIRELRPSRLLVDLEAICEYLGGRGPRRFCLVGSSMGGWAAAWFALRHPQVVAACTLIAPALHFPSARWDRLSPAERDEWRRTGIIRVKNEWLDVELGYGLVEEIPLFPHEQLLAGYMTPTLIFHGFRDELVPLARSLAFLENAKYDSIALHVIKNGDHRLSDHRVELAEGACNFFARVLHSTRSELDVR